MYSCQIRGRPRHGPAGRAFVESAISYAIKAGGLQNREHWPEVQERMIDAVRSVEIGVVAAGGIVGGE